MKMLSVAVDESYAKTIDCLIAASKLYSSRSEFLKDAIRKNLAEMLRFSGDLKKIHEESEKLAQTARERGFTGRNLSGEERDALAKEFVRENALKLE